MLKGCVLNADGVVLWQFEQDAAPAAPAGCACVEGWPPQEGMVYRDGAWTWPPVDLAAAKANQIALMKYRRDAVIFGGFTWDGSRFDSDSESQSRIHGALTSGKPRTWRLADNTWRALSAADLAAVFDALDDHLQTAFTTFATLEAQINAATTLEQALAPAWPA